MVTKWDAWPDPKPRKEECILWHQHPDTNYKMGGTPFAAPLIINRHRHSDPIPDRGSRYGYQLAIGTFTPDKYLGDKGGKWELEIESIGPMVYYGVEVYVEGTPYVKDQQGELHPLEPGDTVIHSPLGTIEIHHYPAKQ